MKAVINDIAESKIKIVLTTAANNHPFPNHIYAQPNIPMIPKDKAM